MLIQKGSLHIPLSCRNNFDKLGNSFNIIWNAEKLCNFQLKLGKSSALFISQTSQYDSGLRIRCIFLFLQCLFLHQILYLGEEITQVESIEINLEHLIWSSVNLFTSRVNKHLFLMKMNLSLYANNLGPDEALQNVTHCMQGYNLAGP